MLRPRSPSTIGVPAARARISRRSPRRTANRTSPGRRTPRCTPRSTHSVPNRRLLRQGWRACTRIEPGRSPFQIRPPSTVRAPRTRARAPSPTSAAPWPWSRTSRRSAGRGRALPSSSSFLPAWVGERPGRRVRRRRKDADHRGAEVGTSGVMEEGAETRFAQSRRSGREAGPEERCRWKRQLFPARWEAGPGKNGDSCRARSGSSARRRIIEIERGRSIGMLRPRSPPINGGIRRRYPDRTTPGRRTHRSNPRGTRPRPATRRSPGCQR